jgi:biotin carboxylase
LNPTDSLTEGFLPAAARLGLDTILLTDQPAAHQAAYAAHSAPPGEIIQCDVRDHRALISRLATLPRQDAIFSNSDHLQSQAALAASFFNLPAKDWRTALRVKNKAQMRRALAAAGVDTVYAAELPPGADPDSLAAAAVPFPCVLKPREGVASEDVFLVEDHAQVRARVAEVRSRQPDLPLVLEEYLEGPLRTLETLGDGARLHVLGGFETDLGAPPHFVECRKRFLGMPASRPLASLLTQLQALGVGFGACHTEYIAQGDRARLVEVNYRIIGDRCDLVLTELLGVDLFAHTLRVHLGEPLPAVLPVADRPRRHARMDWIIATAGGTLTAAPGALEHADSEVSLRYHPLRAIGQRRPLTHTNRDFLGVVSALGPEPAPLDEAIEKFLAQHTWTVSP